MIKVGFPDKIPDEKLEFAVIVARHGGEWVFCKHRQRDTYECPGGHREAGEAIEQTARRELWEETGAEVFSLAQIGPYSVEDGEKTTYGMFYYAEIEKAYDEILRYGYSDERTVAMLKQAKSDVEKKLKKKYKTGE